MNQAHSYPLASLYVGDLHPDVTEAMLFEKFSVIGNVLSIRVCRDMMTRRSLGYAYVNFQLHADAERAMDTMNYDPMKGRPIRIMWSQRDPSLRRSGAGNVFIKNLDKEVDNKAMYDTFSEFGPILSCKVAQDENGSSKGYAFVHFETEAAANRAIERVNGMLLNEKKLYVGKFIPRAEREKNFGDHPRKFTNVFVKNFPEDIDDDKLAKMFEKFGKTTSLRVMTDENGKSRCFGFVSFEQPENAEAAVNEMNGTELNGKTLYVGRAQKRAERQLELRRQYEAKRQERQNRYAGVNLYVKNLDEDIDDERLKKEFLPFGTINSAKIMRDPANGRSKGFGFVCYSTPEEAQKAVQEMNGKVLGTKPLYVAQAQRKEERRTQMQMNQLAQRQQMQQQQPFRPPMPMAYGPAGLAAMGAQQMMYPANFAQPNRGFFPAGPNMGIPMMRQPTQRWQNPMRPQAGGQQQFNQQGGQPGQFRQQGPRGGMRGPAPMGGQQRPQMPNMQMNQGQPRVQGANVNIPPSGPRPQQNGQMINQQGGMGPGMRTGAAAFVRPGNNQAMGQARAAGPVQPQAANIGGTGIDPSMLAKASAGDQKQILGEKLFPIIQKIYPEFAGKVTGMLLEIDNAELLLLLEQPEQLKNKVDEAVTVLKNHMKNAPGAPTVDQMVKTETAK